MGRQAVSDEKEAPQPPIYVPEDPDPLRDGLLAGYRRHVLKEGKS